MAHRSLGIAWLIFIMLLKVAISVNLEMDSKQKKKAMRSLSAFRCRNRHRSGYHHHGFGLHQILNNAVTTAVNNIVPGLVQQQVDAKLDTLNIAENSGDIKPGTYLVQMEYPKIVFPDEYNKNGFIKYATSRSMDGSPVSCSLTFDEGKISGQCGSTDAVGTYQGDSMKFTSRDSKGPFEVAAHYFQKSETAYGFFRFTEMKNDADSKNGVTEQMYLYGPKTCHGAMKLTE